MVTTCRHITCHNKCCENVLTNRLIGPLDLLKMLNLNSSYLHSPVVSLSPVPVIRCCSCLRLTVPVLFLSKAVNAARISCSELMFLLPCSAIIFKNSGNRTFCFPENIEKKNIYDFKRKQCQLAIFKINYLIFICTYSEHNKTQREYSENCQASIVQ